MPDRDDRQTTVIDPDDLKKAITDFRNTRPTDERPTSPLRPDDVTLNKAQWPFVLSMLERVRPWAPHAFRLGLIAMLKDVGARMEHEDAECDLVQEARDIIEALAHMKWAEPTPK